jgi:HK97 gp10 family phage protein
MCAVTVRDAQGRFASRGAARESFGDLGITLNMKPREIEKLLEGEDGPIFRDIERRCIKVQAMASRLCPVDTGRLRASISYDVGKDREGIVGIVGSNVPYSIYVELGTRRAAAQPFLRPALAAAR